MKRWRIAVGGIEHESSSFIPEPTPLEAFSSRYVEGEELARLGNANTIVDGLVRGVRESGMEVVPLSRTSAMSGGLPTQETYASLRENLLQPLREALPVDGVLLSLHGAFAVEGEDDADGDILVSVRKIAGPRCPLIAVHDLHSNISAKMVAAADALIVERTYPHTDMAERGMDAAFLMRRTLAEEVHPTMGFHPLPLFWAAAKMIDSEPPMFEAVRQLVALDERPGVLSASLSVGYQWMDSPIVGASTIVVTDGTHDTAQQLADDLAQWVWDRREIWQCAPLSPEQALESGEAEGRYPILLADQADNTGGGAPGDSTEILRLFIERDLHEAAVLYVVDPEVAAAAKHAGVGATLRVEVGGKSHPLLGPPVQMQTEVLALSDGRFVYDGPMWAGVKDCVGDTALLRQRGVQVLVTSQRQQPVDLALARTVGLDCRQLRYLCVKSTGHFRSGFGPIAGSIYNVDATGLLTQDFRRLPFRRLGRKVYPIDSDTCGA